MKIYNFQKIPKNFLMEWGIMNSIAKFFNRTRNYEINILNPVLFFFYCILMDAIKIFGENEKELETYIN